MIRIEEGEDLVLTEFIYKDEILIPESGSIRVRLKEPSGTVFYDDTVPSSDQVVIESGNLGELWDEYFKLITLILTFDDGGSPKTIKKYVRVQKPSFIYTAERDVRAALGVSVDELPDEDIDLFGRYASVSKSLGVDILADETMLDTANQLILYEEALNQVFFIELKLLKSIEADDIRKTRMKTFDFQGYRDKFEGLIRKLREQFSAEEELEVVTLVEAVGIDDIFTG